MNENQDLSPEPAVAEQNVERLVGKAYQPETADAEFVQRLEAHLCATAVEAAQTRAVAGSMVPRRSLPVRWRLAGVLGAAAALAALTLGWHLRPKDKQPEEPGYHPGKDQAANPKQTPAPHKMAEVPIAPEWLTARPRPPAANTKSLKVGETARTSAERRRLALPDGSVLYLNQNTVVTLEADRRVLLTQGEVFVEVAPRPSGEVGRPAPSAGATFVVKAPGRQATALGTKFAVRADKAGADVVVTQGQVRISDLDRPLFAGQELAAAHKEPSAAPRASHQLAWTKELMEEAESPLVPASDYGGGALVAVNPYGQESRLSLRKYHVDVHIEDGFARTTIDQTYFNHNPARLEGTFYFPLPPDASLSRLAMYVDGNLMEGGMAERDHARTVYESIVRKMKDPALLEWVDGSTFKMRVFPLEGRQEKRIILSYTQRLSTLYGRTQYRFPSGHNLEVVRDWSCHVRVKNGAKLSWNSGSHSMKTSQDKNDLVLDARASDVRLERDIALSLFERESNAEAAGVARWSSAEHENQHYLMLRYRPRLPGKAQRQRRDWVFLFESSGDRDPLLARVQVDVIRTLLANAEHDDTFAIVTAGSRSHLLSDKPQLATPDNIEAGVRFLERSHLIGGLDLGRAFTAAAELVKAGKNPYLVHVGSGLPTLGERREKQLLDQLPESAHYVGVGVGKRWARGLMKQAAERNGGYFTQINPDEPVKWRSFELFSTLSTPRLLDVKVVDNAERAKFLTYTSSVAQGEELCAITRIATNTKQLPESVTISGKLDGKPYQRVVKVKDVGRRADYLPRTWAKLEIDRLLPEANRDPKGSAKAKLVALSKAMYVMTPFTSLLVLENEAMYKQFNVDRGRKDHWAMYPCPQKIPVVREPLNAEAKHDSQKSPGQKPSAEEVLKTILVQVPPAVLTWTDSQGNAQAGHAVTAFDTRVLDLNVRPDVNRQPRGKTYKFDMRGKRWKDVIEWLCEKAELPLVSTNMPTGTFTYVGPKKELTIPEIIDVFNEALLNNRDTQKFLLVRRERSFTILPADNPFDPALLPPLTIEDLENRGNTELATVILPLNSLVAKEVAPGIQQMMGPFGKVNTISETNQILVQDTISNLKRINQMVRHIDRTVAEGRLKARPVVVNGGLNNGNNGGLNIGNFGMGGFGNNAGNFNGNNNGNNGGLNNGNFGNGSIFGNNGNGGGNFGMGGGFGNSGGFGQLGGSGVGFTGGYMNYSPMFLSPTMQWAVPNSYFTYGAFGVPGYARGPSIGFQRYPTSISDGTSQTTFFMERDGDSNVGFNLHNNLGNGLMAKGRLDEAIAQYREAIRLYKDHPIAHHNLGNALMAKGRRDEAVAEYREAIRIQQDHAKFHVSAALAANGSGRLYERPAFSGNNRIFLDLVAYAPGMNTSQADILAVLEAEAASDPRTAPGVIDKKARILIDKARRAVWQTVRIPAGDGEKALTVHIDGSGRFTFERVLPLGLREQVVCDGKTLWHLYPELGIGARRAYSRFHRQAFANLAPWVVPPVEDLAPGADVKCTDERTVAIIPRGADSLKDAAGKPVPYVRTHLIFAADGRLSERQIVIAPAGKVYSRETYAADGTVRRLNADGKELAVVKLVARPGEAAKLRPNTKALVVLPLPLRSREHILQTWTKGNVGQFGQFDRMDEADALAILAADLPVGSDYARMNIVDRFLARNDCRPGFYVLAAAAGIDVVAALPKFKDSTKPVMRYLQWMTGQAKDRPHSKLPEFGDGLFQHLARFRDVLEPWQQPKKPNSEDEYQRLLNYVRASKSPVLTWAVVDTVLKSSRLAPRDEEHAREASVLRTLLDEASKVLAEVPELSYFLRYESARALLQSGDRQKAREQFQELYAQTLKDGRLPPIDHSLRHALGGKDHDDPAWGRLMRQTARDLVGQDRRFAALGLAQQCERLGDASLADELLGIALDQISDKQRLSVTLAGIEWLCQRRLYERADELLQPLLAAKPAAHDAKLWRLAAHIASARRQTARSFAFLDKALEIEYRQLAGDIDLDAVRFDYGVLLAHYEARANALATLEQPAPREFVARVVRAADRWRSLDVDDVAPCETAAWILNKLGAHDLAWAYLTTSLSQRPDQPADWVSVAETWRKNGDLEIADRAYAAAADAQPDNAQLLWDRAQLLHQTGKTAEARQLFQRLADGQWPDRYDGLKAQARQLVDAP
jgi:ferric-dicitrate binding protein FerR (iron transport regulator)/tetratricopeptide (TPR) repeat protein